jgi:hypothetical protein
MCLLGNPERLPTPASQDVRAIVDRQLTPIAFTWRVTQPVTTAVGIVARTRRPLVR